MPTARRSRIGGAARVRSVAGWAIVGLLLPAFALVGPVGPAVPSSSSVGPSPASIVLADAPTLTLVPSPSTGNAPFTVNVTVTVTGGVAPYALSLCFATQDHTSPPASCGTGNPSWTGANPLVFSHLYDLPGSYSVTGVVTDAREAGVGSTALIVVTDLASLAASASELTGSGPAPLLESFNESVQGGTPPITLQWEFGDGTSGSELPGEPVTHVYGSPGTYVPQLTVTDGAGHRTVRTLAAITVVAAKSSPLGPGANLSGAAGLALLAGIFAAAAVAAAALVGFLVRRRWRREGDELVASLRRNASPPGPRIRPPP